MIDWYRQAVCIYRLYFLKLKIAIILKKARYRAKWHPVIFRSSCWAINRIFAITRACYVFLQAMFCVTVSLLTLVAIGIDRLLAHLLGLRYRQVINSRRTRMTLIVWWIFSIVGISTYFWDPLVKSWCINVILPLCLITSFLSYVVFFPFCVITKSKCRTTSPKDNRTNQFHWT